MQIQLEHKGNHSSFFIEKEGQRLAEIIFMAAGPGKIIIEHTEVSDKLRGTGSGKKLVAAVIQYARENKLKILPVCPFAKGVIERTPEFQDILF